MKNKLMMITIVSAFISTYVYAGSYGYAHKEAYYDKGRNLLYVGINEVTKGTFSGKENIEWNIVNFMIYDITNKTSKLIFPKDHKASIRDILYESCYHDESRTILMNNTTPDKSSYYSDENVVNKHEIAKRDTVDAILFAIRKENDASELWRCKKNGSSLTKIASLERHDHWHLDIGNRVIRVIRQKGIETRIEEIEWN